MRQQCDGTLSPGSLARRAPQWPAVLRKNSIPLQSARFRKDFRSEMLKCYVTLLDRAEVVQALRGDY